MKTQKPSVILKKGREKSLRRSHPWIFSGAIEQFSSDAEQGDTVDVRSADGEFLGIGAWSPKSQIKVRMWSFGVKVETDRHFFEERIALALSMRKNLGLGSAHAAYRIVNAEADGLPGIITDCYGRYLVCQFLSAGAERFKKEYIEALIKLFPCDGVWERSDADVREKEGLGRVCGLLWGKEPPALVEIKEEGLRYLVDIRGGHKTGFYLDQRVNRSKIAHFFKARRVLNCFCYSGAFSVVALASGASEVVSIDSSAAALELFKHNIEINNIANKRSHVIKEDAFVALRKMRDSAEKFDLIILDPPKFAESKALLSKAARGYKDINLLAFKLLNRRGFLVSFSCSGLLSRQLFQKIIADASIDAKRHAIIVDQLSQAPDHTISLNFPESEYLKGFIMATQE